MNVLWLTPDKPEDISVGRQRIADHLTEHELDVTLRGTTARTAARSFAERDRYDAVIGTTRAGALAGLAVSRGGGPPLIVDHVDPIRQFATSASRPLTAGVRLGENLSFRLSAATLFVYEEERARVERHASRAVKTDLGVEFDRFAEPDEETLERARAELSDYDLNERVVVYVGGLEPIYDIERLLAAVDHLDDWSLVTVGTGSLEATVRARHDGHSVVHLGTVPHETVPGYLHIADVGVSLVDDPHTLKVLEYGAAGLPVVQLDGRARDRFGDRVTYCDGTPEGIAAAVRTAADNDPTPLREFAARFDWVDVAETYREVITSII